jgi:hypothetical protein
MEPTRKAKKILGSKPEGRRKVRRSRLRLLGYVETDLREPKVKRRRRKVNKIEEQAYVVNEANVPRRPHNRAVSKFTFIWVEDSVLSVAKNLRWLLTMDRRPEENL